MSPKPMGKIGRILTFLMSALLGCFVGVYFGFVGSVWLAHFAFGTGATTGTENGYNVLILLRPIAAGGIALPIGQTALVAPA